ncbi:hypothetical protein GCM10022243_54790 [Saccharothrix violaceirubra]|uniref:Serine/threonine protein phosphatase PrpC n=1 Tax=Saccharothrix violaceirubra TaxID=413306 RepID=A0A7W7WXD7_9PSEU|nr:hypothetical protein [Saccharothrix violaceirubra]MBB4966992.1 serine/threonine protein phosphatase PrpC [Saccharothrix violaceirubra]
MTVLDHRAPSTGWATARNARRYRADAAAVRTSPHAFAAAVADGIGDTPRAAEAARRFAEVALDAAWLHGPTAGIMAARRAASSPHPDEPALTALAPARHAEPGPHRATTPGHDGPPLRLHRPAPHLRPVPNRPAASPDDRPPGNAVLVVATGDHRGWSVAWAGDARAYLVTDGDAIPLTTDHTVGRYFRDRGADPGPRLDHVVTSTVRSGAIGTTHGRSTGRLVLVTDGVHRVLDAATLGRVTRAVADPADAAGALLDAARAAGTTDDCAAVVLDLSRPAARAALHAAA